MGKKKVKSKKEDNELYNNLYQSVNLLRGAVSKNDAKIYLFPLIFYKRISDIYDEETAAAKEKYGDDEYMVNNPNNHRFVIPEGCHWEDICNISEDIGAALYQTFLKIETANEGVLDGIFSNFNEAKWMDKEILSDSRLQGLIMHISKIKLGNKNATNDKIGQVYEIMMKNFADLAKKKAGEFYTPRPVISLMVKVLDPQPGEDIYDPACGTGGMLIEAFNHINDPNRTLGHLYGQESNISTQSMGKINLFLHGAEEFEILDGDTLRKPRFTDSDSSLRQFDIVLANPPFSLSKWGADVWAKDKFGRNVYGIPSDNNGDYAWLQHMIASMKPNGRMAVVMPQGVLFKDNEIRKGVIGSHKIKCVVQLADKMFYATGLAPCILFLENDKKTDKIRFVDGTNIYSRNVSRNFLSEEDIEELFKLITSDDEVEEKAHTAGLDEIKSNDYELSISRYVKKKLVDNTPPYNVQLEIVKNNQKEIERLGSHIESLIGGGIFD